LSIRTPLVCSYHYHCPNELASLLPLNSINSAWFHKHADKNSAFRESLRQNERGQEQIYAWLTIDQDHRQKFDKFTDLLYAGASPQPEPEPKDNMFVRHRKHPVAHARG
jgi:hypothetical protein